MWRSESMEEMDNKRTDLSSAPIDTPIYIIDHNHNLYIGTVTKCPGKSEPQRGECIDGDPELFYRNALIAWAYIKF